MRNLLFTSILIFGFYQITNAQTINIPDANFKGMLLNASPDNSIATNSSHFAITIDTNGDGEIQVSEALQVYQLQIDNANISDLTGIEYFTNLTNLNCSYNQLTSLGTVLSLPNLTALYCNHNQFTTLDVSGITTLTQLACNNNSITSLTLNNNLTYLNCSNNPLGTLDVSALTDLVNLQCNSNSLSNLDVTNLINLQILHCKSNLLTSLNVSTLVNLDRLDFSGNSINTIDLSTLVNLEYLACSQNGLTSLDVSSSPDLIELQCNNNEITSLDVSALNDLKTLYIESNLLTTIDLTALNNLEHLICSHNLFSNLDINALTNLEYLNYGNSGLGNIDVQNQVNLKALFTHFITELPANIENLQNLQSLTITMSEIEEIDVSFLSSLTGFNSLNNELLTYVNLKNGNNFTTEGISFSNNTNLVFVCVNDNDLNNVYDLNNNGDFFVSSYCTFEPGGNYNTITGSVLWDCNETDETVYTKVTIYDGIEEGVAFTDQNGQYTFFTQEGTYIIIPEIENPSFFTLTPPIDAVIFADNNNNEETVDFCIAANGVNPDVEVVIAPLIPARPGFDAKYKIVYRNKGNQTVSGNINIEFDDTRLDFVSSTPNNDNQSVGVLTYNFTDLNPFETRTIEITLNVNSPMETPAVNIDDILPFSAEIITDQTDVIPDDNIYEFNQVVVGAFDPNDIACIEGDVVTPDYIGEELHYVIRFENTGNFYAENVVVRMEIDPAKYDVDSVRLLNTSHNANAQIKNDVLEIFFNQIMLDSGGHGNILLVMKSVSSLSEGDSVLSKADIYFDYNYPIITNDAVTVFEAELSVNNPVLNSLISIYPNPVKDLINLTSEVNIKSYELFDISGRLIITGIINNLEATINLSLQSSGTYFVRINTDNGSIIKKILKD